MQTEEHFYLYTLKKALQSRQRKNPSYSLRSFARDLEIDSSNLSAILTNKRGLPSKRASAVAKKLSLSPKEAALFVTSTHRKQMKLDRITTKNENKTYLLDEKYFRVISEWEHYAILQLIGTRDFKADPKWISERLQITEARVHFVLKHLLDLEFIKPDKQRGYARSTPSLETSEDVESTALQKSHLESLELAKEKLEKIPVELRDFSSITLTVDASKVHQAKALVREFQEKLYSLLSSNETNEVYQFNCQLFPLTKVQK